MDILDKGKKITLTVYLGILQVGGSRSTKMWEVQAIASEHRVYSKKTYLYTDYNGVISAINTHNYYR